MTKNYYDDIKSYLLELKMQNALGNIDIGSAFMDPIIDVIIRSVAHLSSLIDINLSQNLQYLNKNILHFIFPFLLQPKPSIIFIKLSTKKPELLIKKDSILEIYDDITYQYLTLKDEKIYPIIIINSKFITYDAILNNNNNGLFFILFNIKSQSDTIIKDYINVYIESFDKSLDEKILLAILQGKKKIYLLSNNRTCKIIGEIEIENIPHIIRSEYIVSQAHQRMSNYMINSKIFMFLRISLYEEIVINENNEITLLINISHIPLQAYSFIHTNIIIMSNMFNKRSHSWTLEHSNKNEILIDYDLKDNVLIADVCKVCSINRKTNIVSIISSVNMFSHTNDISVEKHWLYTIEHDNNYKTFITIFFNDHDKLSDDEIYYAEVIAINNIKKTLIMSKINFLDISGIDDIITILKPTNTIITNTDSLFGELVNIIGLNSIELLNIENAECNIYRLIIAYASLYNRTINIQIMINKIETYQKILPQIVNNKYLVNAMHHIVNIYLSETFIINIETTLILAIGNYIKLSSSYNDIITIRFLNKDEILILEI